MAGVAGCIDPPIVISVFVLVGVGGAYAGLTVGKVVPCIGVDVLLGIANHDGRTCSVDTDGNGSEQADT